MNPRLMLLTAVLVAAPTAVRADYDQIDKEFAKAAPKILDALRAYVPKNAREPANFGVLKFQVQRPGEKLSAAVGELNMGLADRLEAALIMALPDDEDEIAVLGRPSLSVAAKNNTLANHTTPDGRKAFFLADQPYTLAWGSRSKVVKPAAFIVGTATIAKDLKSVIVELQAFGKDGDLKPLGVAFTAPTSRRTLVEAGYSYALTPERAAAQFDGARGGKAKKEGISQFKEPDERASLEEAVVRNDPARPGQEKSAAAAALTDCPVKLTVLYNGKEVPVENGRVREPAKGDTVSFLLKNTDAKNTYGVVLKVNGKNTIMEEDAEPIYCLKWILDPGKEFEVMGFHKTLEKYTEFEILSDAASDSAAIQYGDLAGLLRMTVFLGERVEEDPSILEKKNVPADTLVLNAVARGAKGLRKGDDQPSSVRGLKKDLTGRQEAPEGARGMMVKGKEEKTLKVQKINFQTLPTVGVADVTIRYYSPKK